MKKTFKNNLIQSIREAAIYDSGSLQAPVAIIWPDPEKQWEPIIDKLQQEMPELLRFGEYDVSKRQGPAIWIKCMVGRTLPEAVLDTKQVPVIYLPGIAKSDLRNLSQADPEIAPLMEYQYTGTLWIHRNGKEWTVNAFLQNKEEGMGLNMAQDNETKEASQKVLAKIFEEPEITYPSQVGSDFLYQLLFKNEVQSILEWMCKGDEYLLSMEPEKQQIFTSICKKKYGFVPVYKNIISIAENLGMKTGEWAAVWDYFVMAPARFPEIINLLEKAKPQGNGEGMFVIPDETWPQVNADAEKVLRNAMEKTDQTSPDNVVSAIKELEKEHGRRRSWVWASLGKANLAQALGYLVKMVESMEQNWDATSIESLKNWYTEKGYLVDYAAIESLASCKSEKEKQAVKVVLSAVYTPWLEKLTNRYQKLVAEKPELFTQLEINAEESECILFVDAFRYDIAKHWLESLDSKKYKVNIDTAWIPLPSLTPTCKPFLSPIADRVSRESNCTEFRPQTIDKKDLTTYQFESELDKASYTMIRQVSELKRGEKCWMEIGKVDKFGHDEQSGLVHRIEELFNLIEERVQDVFASGFTKIRIVTDHGWLLVPGGMPGEKLPKDHIETRWGRCAVLKEGVPSELLHLPWFWNESVMVAYAPGISFFKANNEYAHGGVSLQECLVPVIDIYIEGAAMKRISLEIKWTGLRCNIDIQGAPENARIEIRTKHTDEKTAITEPKSIKRDGKVTLFIEDAEYENTAAFIVITDSNGIVIEKKQTIVGE